MIEPASALAISWKLLRSILALVHTLDESRDQDRAFKHLSGQASQFLELVSRILQVEDATPFKPTIQSLESLLRDILSTAQEYRQMTVSSRLLRLWQTKKKLLQLHMRLEAFRDNYLIQTNTELILRQEALKRSPPAAAVVREEHVISDDIRWEIMTQRDNSSIGGRDRVFSWLDTLRGQTWESETLSGTTLADDLSGGLGYPPSSRMAASTGLKDKIWSPLPRPPDQQGGKHTRPRSDLASDNKANLLLAVVAMLLLLLAYYTTGSPPLLPALEVNASCLPMVAFRAHDNTGTDIGEGNMDKLMTASREYQKACTYLEKRDMGAFLSTVSHAINLVDDVLLRGSVSRTVKTGLRKNLAILHICQASAVLSSRDVSKVDNALHGIRSAERKDPSLNLVHWYRAVALYRKGRLVEAQDILASALRRAEFQDDRLLVDKLVLFHTANKGPPNELAKFRTWLYELMHKDKRSKSRFKGLKGEWQRFINFEFEKRINRTFEEGLRLEGVRDRPVKLKLYTSAIDGMADLLSRQGSDTTNRTRHSWIFAELYNHRARLWLTHTDAFSTEAALWDSQLAEKHNPGSTSAYINQAMALERLHRLSAAKDVLARALKRTDLQNDEEIINALTSLYNPDSKVDLEDDNAFRAWWEEIMVKDKERARLKGIKGKWKERADARVGVPKKSFW